MNNNSLRICVKENDPRIVGYPIISLEHLENLCKGRNEIDCYVRLNFGRSGKHLIVEEDGNVTVINEIDDTSELFDSLKDMIENSSSISEAIKKNAFYVYAYELKEEKAC